MEKQTYKMNYRVDAYWFVVILAILDIYLY